MDMPCNQESLIQFRKLHHGPRMLLLPTPVTCHRANSGLKKKNNGGHPTPRLPRPGGDRLMLLAILMGQHISRCEMLEVVGRHRRARPHSGYRGFGGGLRHYRGRTWRNRESGDRGRWRSE